MGGLLREPMKSVWRFSGAMGGTTDDMLRRRGSSTTKLVELATPSANAWNNITGLALLILAAIILAAIILPHPASAQGTPDTTPQRNAAVSQGTVGAAPGAVVRTPEDIARDRDIVPQGNAPLEVPNRPTIPWDQYLKLKQGSGENTPGNEKGGPAPK
jgi:hypothetical protein